MKIPTEKEREILVNKLREAVVSQVNLWERAFEISESLDCELSEVLDFVNASAITADNGVDLSHADLDDFLGIGVPGRIVGEKAQRT